MLVNKRWFLLLICSLIAAAACTPTGGNEGEPAISPDDSRERSAGEGETVEDLDEPPETTFPDAAAFAEQQGLSLAEANRRLKFQETIGDIQPALMADLPDSFGGLWVDHEPVYRIVIALTEGDESKIKKYIEGREWAEFVAVQPVTFTLEELKSAQFAAGQAADAVNVTVTTAVDVINNRVELMVGNPDLFLEDLAQAGIELPDAVEVLPALADAPLPATNEGVLLEAKTGEGRTIYLPKQPPTGESMAALMEGTLVEVNGCLRLIDENYPDGFLVLWPYDSDFRVTEERIEVLNGQGQVIAQVGERLEAGGGAMESSRSMANFDELIPGMPIQGCPGPYWVAGPIPALD